MTVLNVWIMLAGTIWLAEGFIFDLDIKLDTALQKGGSMSRNTGAYLYDNFRTEIVAPTFGAIIKELKMNRRSDIIAEGVLFILMAIMGTGLTAIWLQIRRRAATGEVQRVP